MFTFIIGINSGCISNSDAPEILIFSSNQNNVSPGEEITLYWFVQGAADVSIIPEIGKVDMIGSKKINVSNTTIFTLIARNMNVITSKNCVINIQSINSNDSIIIDNDDFEIAPRDPYDIRNIQIKNDSLFIGICYDGGCTDHFFSLFSKEQFLESYPVQINVVLAHDNNDDNCDAYITKTLVYDLSNLKEKWQREYQTESGTIIMNLENYEDSIIYQF